MTHHHHAHRANHTPHAGRRVSSESHSSLSLSLRLYLPVSVSSCLRTPELAAVDEEKDTVHEEIGYGQREGDLDFVAGIREEITPDTAPEEERRGEERRGEERRGRH